VIEYFTTKGGMMMSSTYETPVKKRITIKDAIYRYDHANEHSGYKEAYILDNKNAIFLFQNGYQDVERSYLMKHYKLLREYVTEEDLFYENKENPLFQCINSWKLNDYELGKNYQIIGTSLFFVADKEKYIIDNGIRYEVSYGERYYTIYDWKKAEFIVKSGIWDNIVMNSLEFGHQKNLTNINYFEEYGAFVGYFTLKSDETEDFPKFIVWKNPYTNDNMYYSFEQKDDTYFALIEVDGSIRGNKLFQGNSFSEITKVINLKKYGSLENFINFRKKELNMKRDQRKLEYDKKKKELNMEYVTPYLDDEVMKLFIRKKNKKK